LDIPHILEVNDYDYGFMFINGLGVSFCPSAESEKWVQIIVLLLNN
jgi:hypothetical protein